MSSSPLMFNINLDTEVESWLQDYYAICHTESDPKLRAVLLDSITENFVQTILG